MKKHCANQTWLLLAALLMTAFISCSKDENETVTPEPGVEVSDTIYNKLITVSNFLGDTSSLTAPDASRETIYYSLELNKPCPVQYLLTARWDLAFSGTYNTALGGNFGNDQGVGSSFGKGGPGKGGILILEEQFEDVQAVPESAVFSTKAGAVGLDDAGSFGQGIGWAVYDWSGDLFEKIGIGGKDATQAHTCWARPDRTIIVRTALGNYAKLKIISIYKDAPAEPKTKDPSPYFTFQYVIAKPGTKDFTIK